MKLSKLLVILCRNLLYYRLYYYILYYYRLYYYIFIILCIKIVGWDLKEEGNEKKQGEMGI